MYRLKLIAWTEYNVKTMLIRSGIRGGKSMSLSKALSRFMEKSRIQFLQLHPSRGVLEHLPTANPGGSSEACYGAPLRPISCILIGSKASVHSVTESSSPFKLTSICFFAPGVLSISARKCDRPESYFLLPESEASAPCCAIFLFHEYHLSCYCDLCMRQSGL